MCLGKPGGDRLTSADAAFIPSRPLLSNDLTVFKILIIEISIYSNGKHPILSQTKKF